MKEGIHNKGFAGEFGYTTDENVLKSSWVISCFNVELKTNVLEISSVSNTRVDVLHSV
jgi:hypothetical protein